jgi:hypothetical protein
MWIIFAHDSTDGSEHFFGNQQGKCFGTEAAANNARGLMVGLQPKYKDARVKKLEIPPTLVP